MFGTQPDPAARLIRRERRRGGERHGAHIRASGQASREADGSSGPADEVGACSGSPGRVAEVGKAAAAELEAHVIA